MQRSLADYSPWSLIELNMTERLTHTHTPPLYVEFPWWLSSKESTCNAEDAGDMGLISGSRRSPGGGNGNLFQYSCLEKTLSFLH